MALDATNLAAAISAAVNTEMVSQNPLSAAGLKPYHDSIITAIANAVVTHIQEHADVLPGGLPPLNVGGTIVTGKGVVQ